jgi:outer membrane protein assembly factor BamE
MLRLTVLLCAAIAAGCVYRLPIQQGNYLDASTVAQVRPGMTRTQVRYLLGTPMVPGGFDNDRWDYQYYLKVRRLQTARRARAIVHFSNDLVDRVDSDVKDSLPVPLSQRPAAAPGA